MVNPLPSIYLRSKPIITGVADECQFNESTNFETIESK